MAISMKLNYRSIPLVIFVFYIFLIMFGFIPRVFAYGALVLFFVLSPLWFHKAPVYCFLRPGVVSVFFYLMVVFLKDALLFVSGIEVNSLFPVYNLFSLLLFAALTAYLGRDDFVADYSFLMFVFFCVGFAVSAASLVFPGSVFNLNNVGPAMMLPGALSISYFKAFMGVELNRYLRSFVFIFVFILSLVLAARSVTVAMLVSLVLFGGYLFKFRMATPFVAYLGLVVLCIGGAYIGLRLSGDVLLNDLLTHRPVIWGVYMRHFVGEGFWFGLGPIPDAVALEAGAFVREELGAGKGFYGTHSMFVQALFSNGFLGGAFLLVLLAYTVLQKCSREWIVATSCIFMSSLTTVYLVAPSWHGTVAATSVLLLIRLRDPQQPTIIRNKYGY